MARATVPESLPHAPRPPSTPTSPLSPPARTEPIWRVDRWPLDAVPYELAPALSEEEGCGQRVEKLVEEILELRKRNREHEIIQRCFLVTAACCRPPRGAPKLLPGSIEEKEGEEEADIDWALEDELWPDLAGIPDSLAQANDWDRERTRRRRKRAVEVKQARRPIQAGGPERSGFQTANSCLANPTAPSTAPAKAIFPSPSSSGQLSSGRRVARSSGKKPSRQSKGASPRSPSNLITPTLTIDPARILAASTSTIEQQISKTPLIPMSGPLPPPARDRSVTLGKELSGVLDETDDDDEKGGDDADDDDMDITTMAETQVPKRSEKWLKTLAQSRSTSSLRQDSSSAGLDEKMEVDAFVNFLVDDVNWPSS